MTGGSDASPSLASPYLPSLARAREEGLSIPAPFAARLRGAGNLVAHDPTSTLRVAAVQTTGELSRRGLSGLHTEKHDETHVAGALAPFELPLRREVVAFRARATWPAALRISLETTTVTGAAYREAPRPARRIFEGFDCDEAYLRARSLNERYDADPSARGWVCEAHVIPVLLLEFRGWSFRRTIALHALTGRVSVLAPWAE